MTGAGRLAALLLPVKHPIVAVVLGAIGIGVVTIAGVAITSSLAWTRGELSFLQTISDDHTVVLDVVALSIAWLFGTTMGTILLFAWSVLLSVLTRRITVGMSFLVFVGVTWLGNQLMKTIVHRARPDHLMLSDPLGIETSFSYPSGHTCFIAAAAIAVVLMFRGHRRQWLVVVIGAAATLMVAASRVYLGVHHPSDVIAAMLYAVAAAAVIVPLWNRYVVPRLGWVDRPIRAWEHASVRASGRGGGHDIEQQRTKDGEHSDHDGDDGNNLRGRSRPFGGTAQSHEYPDRDDDSAQ